MNGRETPAEVERQITLFEHRNKSLKRLIALRKIQRMQYEARRREGNPGTEGGTEGGARNLACNPARNPQAGASELEQQHERAER